MPICPVCEQPVDANDAYCRYCGAALTQADEGQSAAFRELIEEYRTRTADNPDDDDAHYGLGLAYLHGGQLGPAAQALHRVIELRPDFPDAYAKLSVVYARLGQTARARQLIDEALALAPTNQQYQEISDLLSKLR